MSSVLSTEGSHSFLAQVSRSLSHLSSIRLTGVMCLQLARHRAQNRGKILQAFGNLPNIIQMAQDKAKNLPLSDGEPDSIRLHSTIRDLQQTLLRVLPDLIDRLNPGTLWAKATSPFRGTSIDELLEAVSKSVERVRVCAEGMMEGIIIHTHHTIRDDHEMTRDIRIITEQTGGEVEELRGKVDEILVRQKSLQLTLDAISGKNGLLDFLMEYLKPQQAVPETSPTEPSAAQDGVTPVTPSQLLSLMNVHHLLAVDDESHVIRRSNSFDKVAKGHAATIFQTPQIQQLLHAPESYVVLVDGHLDRAQISRISSLSYVCATLIHALRSRDNGLTLSFFCGQHVGSNDDLQGPPGLMRSLVSSLILSLVQKGFITDLAPLRFSNPPPDFQHLSLSDVCRLFHCLLRLVPPDMPVYCFVDGVSYYEREIWRDEYDLMMDCFSNIIADKTPGIIFKLLLTSPTMSRWLPNLEPHQRVSLRNSRARGR
ncbi:hypothetical protein GQ53DRAFT_399321 [Thozetella sp. PMI_491]|nr:hypothetical protein GQ53DRAFT_399321 [Thozetella sp. PMI_491]